MEVVTGMAIGAAIIGLVCIFWHRILEAVVRFFGLERSGEAHQEPMDPSTKLYWKMLDDDRAGPPSSKARPDRDRADHGAR